MLYVTDDETLLRGVAVKLHRPPLRINSGNISLLAQLSPLAEVLAEVSGLIHVFTDVLTLSGGPRVPGSLGTHQCVNTVYIKTCGLSQVALNTLWPGPLNRRLGARSPRPHTQHVRREGAHWLGRNAVGGAASLVSNFGNDSSAEKGKCRSARSCSDYRDVFFHRSLRSRAAA